MDKLEISRDLLYEILTVDHELTTWGVKASSAIATAEKEPLSQTEVLNLLDELLETMRKENAALVKVVEELKAQRAA